MYWVNTGKGPLVGSYNDCIVLWNSCRNKAMGKPVRASRMMRQPDGTFTFSRYISTVKPYAWVYPDDTVVIDWSGVGTYGKINESQLSDIFPLTYIRTDPGIYRIEHLANVPMKKSHYGATYYDTSKLKQTAPEYFGGIKFNLITGECLNWRPPLKSTADPKINKKWRKAQKDYKIGLIVRAKVGVLDPFVQSYNVSTFRTENTKKPYVQRLGEAIRDQDFSNDTLEMFVWSALYRYGYRSQDPNVIAEKGFQSLLDANRTELKRVFGVYKQPEQG